MIERTSDAMKAANGTTKKFEQALEALERAEEACNDLLDASAAGGPVAIAAEWAAGEVKRVRRSLQGSAQGARS